MIRLERKSSRLNQAAFAGMLLIASPALYFGSYAILSANGRYVVGAWGLAGPKWHVWAPLGFVDGSESFNRSTLNKVLVRFYLPCWWIDRRCWHEDRG